MSGILREILIFISGASPQLITETIYALSQKKPAICPDEVFVITTASGKRRILDALMGREILAGLCAEYCLPPLRLTDASFVVIKDPQGAELDDICNVEANEAAGDQIAAFLRQKAAEPNTRLHCTLADGRKSMSYYMGMAFQLFARQWDRLYHVLVSPEFEESEQFFYKPRINQEIETRLQDGSTRTLQTQDAEISLIELPLILLRDKFALSGSGVRELTVQGQKKVSSATVQLPVEVNLAARQLRLGGAAIDFPPTLLMVYAAFLRRKLRQTCNGERTHCFECHGCFMHVTELMGRQPMEAMALDYAAMHGGNESKKSELLRKWPDGFLQEHIRQNVCKFNRVLRDNLADPTLVPIYEIASDRKYANSRYGVRVEKENVSIG